MSGWCTKINTFKLPDLLFHFFLYRFVKKFKRLKAEHQ